MIHLIWLSRITATIDLKAILVSAVNNIDKISPDTICNTRVNPSMNPIFHINEMEAGAGRSNRDFFTKFKIGFILVSWFFIFLISRCQS